MTVEASRAPFPYFGGKGGAAPIVWDLLGDPGRYCEPFSGSAAVLLARPASPKRRHETINDIDGFIANVWRALRFAPDDVAEWAHGPMTEVDLHARAANLAGRDRAGLVSWLEGDPERFDAKLAAWWLYVASGSIGSPLVGGPWQVVDGHLVDTRELPHLSGGRGITRELPHLSHGRGITRELPHLSGGQEQLQVWFRQLSQRLQWVNICCRDWTGLVTEAVVHNKSSQAVFLDPPYHHSGDVYTHHGSEGQIADQVRDWCISSAPPLARIVLAGYDNDHDDLLTHRWTKHVSRSTRGYGRGGPATDAWNREQLWASPSCGGQSQMALI